MVAGFALAFLAIGGFLTAVGPSRVFAELAAADPAVLAVGFVSIVFALACWSEAMRRLIVATGNPVGGRTYRLAYLSGEFLKQVIPLGQSAGPALVAYTVTRKSEASYEETLAATSVFAFLNVVVSLVVAVAGLGLLVATRRGPTGPLLRTVLVVMTVVTAGIVAIVALATYRRGLLEGAVLRLVAGVRRTLGRLSARVDAALEPGRIRTALDGFTAAIDRLGSDRRRTVAVLVFAVAGWLFFLLPMFTSFRAIGAPVPFALVVFAVPVVTLLNVVPLPGGLGGFEVALAAVIAAIGAVDLPTAAAGVFLFRLSNYWFLVLLGGLAATTLSVGVDDPPSVVSAPAEGE